MPKRVWRESWHTHFKSVSLEHLFDGGQRNVVAMDRMVNVPVLEPSSKIISQRNCGTDLLGLFSARRIETDKTGFEVDLCSDTQFQDGAWSCPGVESDHD